MAAAKLSFLVLLEDPAVLATSLGAIARVVARANGEPTPDAAQRVRYGGGIVARDLPHPEARQIARGLAALGLGSFLVPSAAFVPAPRPRRVGSIRLADDALELAVRLKPPRAHRWAEVQAIHAYAWMAEAGSDEREGLPRRGGAGLSAETVRTIEAMRDLEHKHRAVVHLAIDLLLEGPAVYRLAYDEPGLYLHLEERREHSFENFRLLLQALLAAAPPSVRVVPTAASLLDGDLAAALFTKPEELDAFTAWLIQAVTHGVDASDAPDDLPEDDLPEDDLPEDDEAIHVGDRQRGREDQDEAAPERGELEAELTAAARAAAALEGRSPTAGDFERALERFAETRRLDRGDLRAMLAEARETEDLDDDAALDPALLDPEVREAARQFDVDSGTWSASQLRAGDLEGEDLEGEDLEGEDLDGAEPGDLEGARDRRS